MNRKIYFTISGIVQIIIAIYSLFNIKTIASEVLEQLNGLSGAMTERISGLMNNGGGAYFVFLIGIAILINIYIIYLALNNKLLKKKGNVIACSVALLFTSMSPLTELFAIINIIVICSLKRVNKEDFPDEKKEMPILKKESINKEKIIYAIILLGVYFSQFLWKNLVPDDVTLEIIISIIFYLVMIVLSIVFFNDLLKKNFKVFKDNFKAYFQNLIRYVGIFYLIYLVVAWLSIILSKGSVSVNQEHVEALPVWLSIPLAIIYAPIVEETLFRGCLRRFIKDDKIFIIVSAIVFGLLHTVFTETSIYNVFVVGLPYMAMGGFLAYLYVKTNNICTNMAFHSFHNTFAMIISLLIKGI